MEWCYRKSATLFQMNRRHPDKRQYGILSFVIGNMDERSRCYIFIKKVKRDGRGENIL